MPETEKPVDDVWERSRRLTNVVLGREQLDQGPSVLYGDTDSLEFIAESNRRGVGELFERQKKAMAPAVFENFRKQFLTKSFLLEKGAPRESIANGQALNAYAGFHKIQPEEVHGHIQQRQKVELHKQKVHRAAFDVGQNTFLMGGQEEGLAALLEGQEDSLKEGIRRGYQLGRERATEQFGDVHWQIKNTVATLRDFVEQETESGGDKDGIEAVYGWYGTATQEEKHRWRQGVRMLARQEGQAAGWYGPDKRLSRPAMKALHSFGAWLGKGFEEVGDIVGLEDSDTIRNHHEFRRDVWRLLDSDIDPTWETENASSFRKGMESARESIPFWATYLAGGVTGGLLGGAILESENAYVELREKYPEVDDTQLQAVANAVGPINSAIELLSFRLLGSWAKSTLPGYGKLTQELAARGGLSQVLKEVGVRGASAKALREGGRFAWLFGQEFATETAQDMMTPIMSAILADLPNFDLGEEMRQVMADSPTRAWAVLPFVTLGGAARSIQGQAQLNEIRNVLTADTIWESGLSRAEIEAVQKEAPSDPEGALKSYQRAFNNLTPEERSANRESIGKDMAREQAEVSDLPVVRESEGGYDVFLPGQPVEHVQGASEVEAIVVPWAMQAAEDTSGDLKQLLEELDPVRMEQLTEELAEIRRGAGIKETVTITEENLTPEGETPALLAAKAVLKNTQGLESESAKAVGRNYLEQGPEGKVRAIIDLAKGRASPFLLLREGAQSFLKQEVSGGSVSMQWVAENLQEVERKTGRKILDDPSDQAQVIEGFSDLALAVAAGEVASASLPQKFIAWLRSFLTTIQEMLTLSKEVQRLQSEGKLNKEFEQFIRKSIGADVDPVAIEQQVTAEMVQEIEAALEGDFLRGETFSLEEFYAHEESIAPLFGTAENPKRYFHFTNVKWRDNVPRTDTASRGGLFVAEDAFSAEKGAMATYLEIENPVDLSNANNAVIPLILRPAPTVGFDAPPIIKDVLNELDGTVIENVEEERSEYDRADRLKKKLVKNYERFAPVEFLKNPTVEQISAWYKRVDRLETEPVTTKGEAKWKAAKERLYFAARTRLKSAGLRGRELKRAAATASSMAWGHVVDVEEGGNYVIRVSGLPESLRGQEDILRASRKNAMGWEQFEDYSAPTKKNLPSILRSLGYGYAQIADEAAGTLVVLRPGLAKSALSSDYDPLSPTFSLEDNMPLVRALQTRIESGSKEVVPFLQNAQKRLRDIGDGYLAEGDRPQVETVEVPIEAVDAILKGEVSGFSRAGKSTQLSERDVSALRKAVAEFEKLPEKRKAARKLVRFERLVTGLTPESSLRTAVAYLSAIQKALPAEIQKQVGSFQALGQYKTIGSMEKAIEQRLPRIEAAIERYLQKAFRLQVRKEIDKSLAKKDQKTRRAKAKIDALGSHLAEEAVRAMTIDIDKAGEMAEAARAKSEVEEDPVKAEELEGEALVLDLFADYDNADSTRLAQIVEFLQMNYAEGRKVRLEEMTRRKEEKQERIEAVLEAMGGIVDADNLDKAVRSMRSAGRELQSFYEVVAALQKVKGQKGAVIKEFADEVRRANNAWEDSTYTSRDNIGEAVKKIWGIKGKGPIADAKVGEVLFNLSQQVMQNEVTRVAGRDVQEVAVPKEAVEQLLRRESDGFTTDKGERITLSESDIGLLSKAVEKFEELPTKAQNQRKVIRFERLTAKGRRRSVGKMSQLDLLKDWLAIGQQDIKEKYENVGWDERYRRELNDALLPEVKVLGNWLRQQLKEMTPEVDRVHRQEVGLRLAAIENYFPVLFKHPHNQEELSMDGNAIKRPGGPSALKGRVQHRAEPKRENALAVYNAHMQQMRHWMTHAQLLREWGPVLRSLEVQDTMKVRVSPEVAKAVRTWLGLIENQGRDQALLHLESSGLVRKITSGFALGVLAGKLKTLALNASAVGNVILHTRLDQLLKGLRPGVWRDVKKLFRSDTFQRRLKMGGSYVARVALEARPDGRFVPTLGRRLSEYGIQSINVVDTFANLSVALAYRAKLEQLRKENPGATDKELEAEGLDHVDDILARVAQPTTYLSRSLFENKNRDGMAGLMFLFASEARKNMSIMFSAAPKIFKKGEDNALAAQQFLMVSLGLSAWAHIMTAIFHAFVKDDEEDNWEAMVEKVMDGKRYLHAVFSEPLRGIPLLGDAGNYGAALILDQKAFTGTNNPLTRVVQSAGSVKSLFDDDKTSGEIVKKSLDIVQGLASILPETAFLAQTANIAEEMIGIYENTIEGDLSEADALKRRVGRARKHREEINKKERDAYKEALEQYKKTKDQRHRDERARIERERDSEYAAYLNSKIYEMGQSDRNKFLEELKEKGLIKKSVAEALGYLETLYPDE